MNEGENAVVSSMKVSRCCPGVTKGIGDAMRPGAVTNQQMTGGFLF